MNSENMYIPQSDDYDPDDMSDERIEDYSDRSDTFHRTNWELDFND